MNFRFFGALLALSMVCSPVAGAQDNYPDKPIQIVVPYPPGGPSDTLARLIGQSLSSELGQPVIIENKAGGAATIGTGYVARQAPDGYTLLLIAAHLVTNAATGVKTPYDPIRDLQPVAMLAKMPILVAINPKVPADDMASLIAWIRAQKQPVQYASPGAGSLTQLWGELLAQSQALHLEHVPYKGSAGAARATIAGEVPLLFDVGGITTAMIQQGKLKGILTPGGEPAPGLPNLPTARDAGMVEMEASSFLGLVGPAHLPDNVVRKLNQAVNQALMRPDVIKAIATLGLQPAGGKPEELRELLASEMKRWTGVARTAGITSPN
ncbi:tripartite tricarboxylate transporter substrate binding protein [Bordetella petrii]|nr:tripartite tricarboxylate transporter substrate binding protein [Bordetella petrii]